MENSFLSIGLTHWQSPIKVREQFSMTEGTSELLIKEGIKLGIKSIFIISTCNRTEIFANNANVHSLKKLFLKYSNGQQKDFEKYSLILKNDEAIEHLFKISTGLDSQILGDLQILSQVKHSIKLSKRLNAIDTYTDKLLQFVFQANKEIQSFTNISKGAASIAHATFLYIRDVFHNMKNKKILLYGLGQIGKRTIENLISHKLKNITIINRTIQKANTISKKYKIPLANEDTLAKNIELADIIIVATNSKNYTINQKQVKNNTNKILIDLSVPRNIDPEIGTKSNIDLINIDSLKKVTDQTLLNRKKDLPKANTIINLHKNEFTEWAKLSVLGPTIKKLKLIFETEKNNEIKKHKSKYSIEELEKITPLIDSIIQRISKKNIEYLRERFRHNSDILEIIREMYKLDAH